MATLREYFDNDFNYAIRLNVKLPINDPAVEAAILYDFAAFNAFLTCYVPGDRHTISKFLGLLDEIKPGATQVLLTGQVFLPAARFFPGYLDVRNTNPFVLRARFHGDSEWISFTDIPHSTRLFIYSESHLTDSQVSRLKEKGRELKLQIQFRSNNHAAERSKHENPLAFISHDSRDKEVARQIAFGLQRLLCPVWYDEFSLKVGDNLRDSIETGLKKCKKCILILSPNFFANGGWTKKEFDSIFTREILEERKLILPIWHGVSKQSVFDYCPSLLNVKGLNWELGEEVICRHLYNAILN